MHTVTSLESGGFAGANWMRTVLTLAAAGFLSGCAGVSYIIDNYSDVEHVEYRYVTNAAELGGYKIVRVFDKPAEDRLMITPTIGEAVGQGVSRGLTLGLVDTDAPVAYYRDAAAAYLSSTGRSCDITSVDLLQRPQYEVRYRCVTPDPAKLQPLGEDAVKAFKAAYLVVDDPSKIDPLVRAVRKKREAEPYRFDKI